MDPTGASTFIDMSRLKVGESYAEEVFPFSNGVFREPMAEFTVGSVIPGGGLARRGIIVSQFREQKKKNSHTYDLFAFVFRTPGLAHALSPELWFYIQGAPEDSPGLPELFLTPFDVGWECNMRMAGKGIMYIYGYI